MVKVFRLTDQYMNEFNEFLEKENIILNDYINTFILIEGTISGFSNYEEIDGKIYIKDIFIMESKRKKNLGDTLFRTVLNALYINNIETVYMKNNPIYSKFLEKENISFQGEYIIETHEFFNRPCKGEKIFL